MELNKEPITSAKASIGRAQYQTIISSAGHTLIADEPETSNGADTGMSPHSLLLASLGSCTAITLRMYINRKMWPVEEVMVDLELFKTTGGTLIERKLSFKGELSEAQKQRLVEIADACPIHKILVGSITIDTHIK
jgi:putative redox protein